LVISHCHADHIGELTALSEIIPMGRFYGRGDDIEKWNLGSAQTRLNALVEADSGWW